MVAVEPVAVTDVLAGCRWEVAPESAGVSVDGADQIGQSRGGVAGPISTVFAEALGVDGRPRKCRWFRPRQRYRRHSGPSRRHRQSCSSPPRRLLRQTGR